MTPTFTTQSAREAFDEICERAVLSEKAMDAFARLGRELAELQQATRWQPIETAPVSEDIFLGDVSPCLVYGPDVGVRIGRAWRYADGTAGADSAMLCGDWEYTHWMPLPAPPSEA